MFKKVVIANRGAVAARLVRTLRSLSVASVALYSEADAGLPYVAAADESRLIGPAPAPLSYLNQEAILEAALATGAEAIHPGYGFLSENSDFADKVIKAGLTFIGPHPKWLRLMGDKTAAKALMAAENFPVSPSTGLLSGTLEEQVREAAALGFPLLIKPAGGGGGIGMTPVETEDKLASAIESASKLAARSFGQAALYAERLLTNPRHVEFQIVADRQGRAVHLFERDCSIQRRRQKIVEEAGAPNIPAADLAAMADRAAEVLNRLGYNSLGTVETLYSPETGPQTGLNAGEHSSDRKGSSENGLGQCSSGFSFLEVNPRLQVEHGVTEEVTGLDLVALQIRLAAGEALAQALPNRPAAVSGHAVEARIYAEDPVKFFPSPGPLKIFRPPQGKNVRVETGFAEGGVITPNYDPMIALVIVKADNRLAALDLMDEALGEFAVEGIKTNIPFVRGMMKYEPFREGRVHTGLAEEYLRSVKPA